MSTKTASRSKRVTLPYPHIGTLSCSPEIDSINTLTPDSHGANMDLPDMGPGSSPTCRCARKARAFSSATRMLPGRRPRSAAPREYRARRRSTSTSSRLGARLATPGERDAVMAIGSARRSKTRRASPTRNSCSGWKPSSATSAGRLHDAQPVRQGCAGQLRDPSTRWGAAREEVSRLNTRRLAWTCN